MSLRNVSLSVRIYGLVALGAVATVGGVGTIVMDSRSAERQYHVLIDQDVARQDEIRVMQVTFKEQIQQWKNVLLRGHDAEALAKHKTGFLAKERTVDSLAAAIQASLADSLARAEVARFAQAHQAIGSVYHAALESFEAGKGRNPRDTDAMVAGIDQEATAILDGIVRSYSDRIEAGADALAAARARTINLLLAIVARRADVRPEPWASPPAKRLYWMRSGPGQPLRADGVLKDACASSGATGWRRPQARR